MNPDLYCPIRGCNHSIDGTHAPFLTRTTLIRHLHSPTHATTHHLVNHTLCATAGIYTCCKSNCPSSPKIFFSSLRALHDHCTTIHPPPPYPPPTPNIPPSTPFAISSHLLQIHAPPHTVNHWMHGLDFINSVYDHEPPDFRTTWRHFLRSRNKSAFCNLQASIIRAIVVSSTNCPIIDDTSPFWWLLLHLDMLIFTPSTRKQRSDSSIQNTIRDRIDAAFSGDIAYLFNSAMNVKRLTQNTRPAYIGKNRSAQLAANNDEYRTAVSLACSSQSIATIGSHNISHINKLYTQPVPPRNHQQPTPSAPSQQFSLPGDICKTILHAAKNKGAGINADTIDLFTTLVKSSIPTVKPDLHFIFDLIYQNKLPECIKRYFTDVSYSVSTRTPTTQPNSAP